MNLIKGNWDSVIKVITTRKYSYQKIKKKFFIWVNNCVEDKVKVKNEIPYLEKYTVAMETSSSRYICNNNVKQSSSLTQFLAMFGSLYLVIDLLNTERMVTLL